MPSPLVKKIATQVDTTEEEVEKIWKKLEKQYKGKGLEGGNLYQAVVGTLKKIYGPKGYKPGSKKESLVEDYQRIFPQEPLWFNRSDSIMMESWESQVNFRFVQDACHRVKKAILASGVRSEMSYLEYLDEEFSPYNISFQITIGSGWKSDRVGNHLIIHVPRNSFKNLNEKEFAREIEDQILVWS